MTTAYSTPRIITVAEVERYLAALIAEKLNLTVDKDIFRGSIPPNCDGYCVRVHGKSTDEVGFKLYNILFYGKNVNRDVLVQAFSDWEANLVAFRYSPPTATDAVKLRQLRPGTASYATIADSGRLKHEAAMHFDVLA